MIASKLSRGLIEFDVTARIVLWNFHLLKCARIAATCSSCFGTLCYSFSFKPILAGRSLCRSRAERRKVAHGFSSWFARQKNLLSSPMERGLRRKDSFFGGRLRQAKRTFRRVTSNAEKTLLYVESEAEEKRCARTRVFATRCSTWTRNGVPRYIHMYYERSGQRKTRWFLAFADFSNLTRV